MARENLLIPTLLIVVIILNLAAFISENSALYTKPFDPHYYKDLYGKSQYVRVEPLAVIPDEFVYSHAAWEYLQGANPAVFNADQPPLGKYFIGISEKYFNNEKLTGPIFNILSLIALFFLGKLILKSNAWSLGLVALFSLEKLFMVQMLYAPLLDNIQLFFILLSFIFYILSLRNANYLFPAFLMLGAVMSVKFWATGVVIFVIWLTHTFFSKDSKRLVRLLLTSPAALLTMLAVYLPSFLQGDSLRRFFGVQKYIFEFHKAKLHLDPTAVWDLTIFNRWHVPWDGRIVPSVDWQLTWPLVTIGALIALVKIARSEKYGLRSEVGLFAIWFVAYFALLTVSAVLPRYLIPVLPAMYILTFWLLQKEKVFSPRKS